MAINVTKVNKTSSETKAAIQRKSAQTLPNNPSERGYSAEEIKRRFYKPIIDATNSTISEIDRVVDETNTAIENVSEGLEDFINSTEITDAYRLKFDNEVWALDAATNLYEVFIRQEDHGISDYNKIGVDMFLLDSSGNYIQVNQFEIMMDGTVRCYHDSNGAGHISIYEKREGLVVAEGIVSVDKIEGLAKVAQTNDYNDLYNLPNDDLAKNNEVKIAKIISGVTSVGNAINARNADKATYAQTCDSASNATNAINATKSNQDSDGNVIKDTYAKISGTYSNMSVGKSDSATKASQDSDGNTINTTYAKTNGTYSNMVAGTAVKALYASDDQSKGTIEERLTNLGFKQGGFRIMFVEERKITLKINEIKRQGNYCIANLHAEYQEGLYVTRGGEEIALMGFSEIDTPKNPESLNPIALVSSVYESTPRRDWVACYFEGDDLIVPIPRYAPIGESIQVTDVEIIHFGYEAEPLT